MIIKANPGHSEEDISNCECLKCIQLREFEQNYYDKWFDKWSKNQLLRITHFQRLSYNEVLILFRNRNYKKLKTIYKYGRPPIVKFYTINTNINFDNW